MVDLEQKERARVLDVTVLAQDTNCTETDIVQNCMEIFFTVHIEYGQNKRQNEEMQNNKNENNILQAGEEVDGDIVEAYLISRGRCWAST